MTRDDVRLIVAFCGSLLGFGAVLGALLGWVGSLDLDVDV